MRTRASVTAVLAVLILHAWPARAGDRLSFRGYVKNFSILIMPPASILAETTVDEPDLGAVNNRLRLEMAYRPSNRISVDFAYDVSPRIQDSRLFGQDFFFPGLTLPEYRLLDFRDILYPGPGQTPASFALYHNLDRFSVTIRTGGADIILGRQAVAWGSARVVNPTDIIAPFSFNELDKEERLGVDAVRVRIPLGPLDELDTGVVAGRDFASANNAFFIRGKTYQLKTDISGLLLAFRDHLLIGLDLARALGGAGLWLEAAWAIPDAFRENRRETEKSYCRVSFGLDYSPSSDTYGFIEYHFSSAGEGRPENYIHLLNTSPYQDGAVYLLGRHYLNFGATVQLSPLLPFTGLVILNLNDRSVVLAPQLEYNIAENIYLAGGAYIGFGKRPETVLGPSDAPPRLLHSEFGAYPDMIFSSFRVYF
ncbi:MAG: hypothetical protein WAU81_07725 [Candidatus Aminicenantales bacterium]